MAVERFFRAAEPGYVFLTKKIGGSNYSADAPM